MADIPKWQLNGDWFDVWKSRPRRRLRVQVESQRAIEQTHSVRLERAWLIACS